MTQERWPLATGGGFALPGSGDFVPMTRLQLEIDTGRSKRRAGKVHVDLNRAGAALAELVFEPVIRSAEDAGAAVALLRDTLVAVNACDGAMERGSLRCDLNISLDRDDGSRGGRVEVKNLNSIRAVVEAAQHEEARHRGIVAAGGAVPSETRSWDDKAFETVPMRKKEGHVDYRFMLEPDLPPLRIDADRLDALRAALPELPEASRHRLVEQYGLPEYDAGVLVGAPGAVMFFDATVACRAAGGADADAYKSASNWVSNDLPALARKKRGLDPNKPVDAAFFAPVTPKALAEVLDLLAAGTVSTKVAKTSLLTAVWDAGADGPSPAEIVDANGWGPLPIEALHAAVEAIVDDPAHAKQLAQYLRGKEKLYKFFVGKAMGATKGRAAPDALGEVLTAALGRRKEEAESE